MKPKRLLLLSALLITAVGLGFYLYVFVFSAKHRTAAEVAGIPVRADSLVMAFEADEVSANARYLKQVLRVTGAVLEKGTNQQGQQTLMLGRAEDFAHVYVTMEQTINTAVGDTITVKGFCNGFLSDVVLTSGIPADRAIN